MIDMNGETISDNKNRPIYQISLDSTSLGLINPYLFVEKLRDEIFIKLPNIKVIVAYNPKGKGQALVNLKFFPLILLQIIKPMTFNRKLALLLLLCVMN